MPRILAPLLIAAALAAPAVPAGATSLSGAYLAATQADIRDDYAGAALYYTEVLALDPENPGILANALVAQVALGDFAAARPLSDRLEAADPNNQVAALVRLGDTLATGDFAAAQAILDKTADTQNPLLAGLLAGWIDVGREDFDAARATFDAMTDGDAITAYGQYHKALALAFAGDFVGAEAILAGGDKGPLHLNRSSIVAHAEILAQLGREADAIEVLDDALAGGIPDAPLLDLRGRLAAGQEVAFDVVTRARDGAAEAFLTLADALNTSDSQRVALMHARIAARIRPDLIEADLLAAEILEDEGQHVLATAALASVPATSPWYVTAQIRRANTQRAADDPDAGIVTLTALAAGHPDQIEVQSALNTSDSQRVALMHARIAAHIRPDLIEANLLAAEILEDEGQHVLAIEALASVPATSPWYVTAQIRRANTQRAADDPDAGIVTLTALAAGHPDQIEVQSALGDALRMAERYPESVAAYDAAIALVPSPMPVHWPLYYTRGIANERAGNWPAAEADFRAALKLEPDQPLVLNYLGYSMVEKQEKLDEALGMIERASKAEPDDGYITDSLGWVLYRLGRYGEAVKPMLRAVELTPDDPVINDHLGDVLWMVGRKREAEFQWRRALSFGPSDDLDLDRVRRKLEVGLDKVLAEEPKQDG